MAGTCQVDRRAPWLLGHVLVLTTCPQVLSLSFLPVKICCGWCWGCWLVEHVVHMCSLLAPHPSPHLLSPILIHNPRQGSQEYFGNLKKDKLCNFLKKLRNCRLGDCYVGSIRYQIVRAWRASTSAWYFIKSQNHRFCGFAFTNSFHLKHLRSRVFRSEAMESLVSGSYSVCLRPPKRRDLGIHGMLWLQDLWYSLNLCCDNL